MIFFNKVQEIIPNPKIILYQIALFPLALAKYPPTHPPGTVVSKDVRLNKLHF